jgi:hypothetical protein
MIVRLLRLSRLGGPGLVIALVAAAHPVAAEEPDLTAWAETFAGCKLGEVKGATLAIKSYACGAEQGNVHLEADDTLPGFVEVLDSSDGPMRIVKIRTFKKAAEAPIESVLAAVQAASPGPHTDTCAFAPAPGDDDGGSKRVVLAPTGDAKVAWDAAEQKGEPIDPQCGALGVQFEGDLYFRVLADDPTTVVFVDAGSEIQIFIPSTLKSVAAH